MLTPGARRRRRREPIIAVSVLVAVGIAVALVILLSSGDSPHTKKPTPVVHHKPPPRKRVTDTFVWPFYGYSSARTRFLAASRRFGPPLRRGWHYNDFALLEFPPVMYHDDLFFIDYTGLARAVDKRNGHRIWRRKVGTLAAVTPAVDSADKLVLIPLLSTTPGARLPGHGRFVALSMKTGRVVWSRSIPAGSESSPVVHRGSVFLGAADGSVYSFKAKNGHLKWTFHAGGAVKGGVAYSGGEIFFGDYGGRVYAVNAATGREIWSTAAGGGNFYGSPAVAFGRIFVGSTDGHVYALSKTGRLRWSAGTGAYVYSSPAAANVRGLGPTVFTGSYDGNFYALNANSGRVRWRHASGGPVSGSGTIIGHVVYYSVIHVRNTIGLDTRTGRQVFFFPDGAFAAAIADHRAIYLIGASTIYQMLPKRSR
ncbi:MAG: PQQ-binding-like beta-propeller repeat protein [Solirubrobacteraceae bacterium]